MIVFSFLQVWKAGSTTLCSVPNRAGAFPSCTQNQQEQQVPEQTEEKKLFSSPQFSTEMGDHVLLMRNQSAEILTALSQVQTQVGQRTAQEHP